MDLRRLNNPVVLPSALIADNVGAIRPTTPPPPVISEKNESLSWAKLKVIIRIDKLIM